MSEPAYVVAFNRAVDDANAFGRTIQLRSEKGYGKTTYAVTVAVSEGRRYGVDAEGEFIQPGTPKMRIRPVITLDTIAIAIDLWARGDARIDLGDGWLPKLAEAYRNRLRAEGPQP